MYNLLANFIIRLVTIAENIYRFLVRKLYEGSGRNAWSIGYFSYRNHYIENVLKDDELILKFAKNEQLPLGYGIGLDERCVEYAWFLSRMDTGWAGVLDAGATLNWECQESCVNGLASWSQRTPVFKADG